MTTKLFERIRAIATLGKIANGNATLDKIDVDKLHKICNEFESRMEGVNRNNIILERSICPAGKCRLNREGK